MPVAARFSEPVQTGPGAIQPPIAPRPHLHGLELIIHIFGKDDKHNQ